MNIEYYAKNVYGNWVFYVKDPAVYQAIKTLTKKQTIDKQDIQALQKLGHTCTEVLPQH